MSKNIKAKCWILAALAVITGSISLSSGHFENPDAHLRLVQAFSMSSGNGFKIPDGIGNPNHGNIATSPSGARFSVYSPGQIILFAPFAWLSETLSAYSFLHKHYVAESMVASLGIAAHLSTALLIFVAARSLGRDSKTATILALLFAFCTVNLPSSRDGYEHAYEGFFLLASFIAAWRATTEAPLPHGLLFAGLMLGIGALFRPNILLALPGLLIIARQPRAAASLVTGVTPGIVVLLAYNMHRFGSPLTTGYSEAWAIANPSLQQHFDISLQHMLPAAFGLLLSPGKGLFIFTPLLLSLILLGVSSDVRTRRIIVPILVTSAAYIAFFSANFAWHGSAWSWGPRYIIAVVPLLVLLLPIGGDSIIRRWILYLLATVSALIQVAALIGNYKRHLLQLWRDQPDVFANGEVFFNPALSPILGIFSSSYAALSNVVSGIKYYAYLDPQGWRSEARPASIDMMISSSIDLNSVDLWWIRILHFPLPWSLQISGVAVGVLSLLLFAWFVRRLVAVKA